MKLLERSHNSFDLVLYPTIADKLESFPALLETANEMFKIGIRLQDLEREFNEREKP